MARKHEYKKELAERLKQMIPSDTVDVNEALKKQSQFAKAWAKDLNNMIFQASSQHQALDLKDIVMKVQKGEQVLTMSPAKPVVYPGDIVTDIFSIDEIPGGTVAEYPVELTDDTDYIAVEIPDDGALPERITVTDHALVRCFKYGNSVSWKQDYALNGNVLAINKARNRFNMGFLKKMNDVGWKAILGAAVARNVVVRDASATSGDFTRPLLTGMIRQMRRLGGGNAASNNGFKLTDLFISLEAMEKMLLWDSNDTPSINIFNDLIQQGFTTYRLHGVNVHVMDELGVGQEYETYLESLGADPSSYSKQEFCIGLDLSKEDTFVMPISQRVQVIPVPSLLEKQRMGMNGWTQFGAAVLDARAVLLGVL